MSWSSPAAAELRLAVLGDSLTAGYGLALEQAFPARLEAALVESGFDVRVINAGVSGDTTAGGLARLDWLLADRPNFVVLALGANDGLRGLPTEAMYENLAAIINRLYDLGIPVLIAGMYAPPNYGPDYGKAFAAVYEQLGVEYDAPLYRFFLDGVVGDPTLMLNDGIHPNAAGVAVMVERILPLVQSWLQAE